MLKPIRPCNPGITMAGKGKDNRDDCGPGRSWGLWGFGGLGVWGFGGLGVWGFGALGVWGFGGLGVWGVVWCGVV